MQLPCPIKTYDRYISWPKVTRCDLFKRKIITGEKIRGNLISVWDGKDEEAIKIILEICLEYDITKKNLLGKNRLRKFVIPRHVAMFRLVREVKLPLVEVAKLFKCDHTSVGHAVYHSAWVEHLR